MTETQITDIARRFIASTTLPNGHAYISEANIVPFALALQKAHRKETQRREAENRRYSYLAKQKAYK